MMGPVTAAVLIGFHLDFALGFDVSHYRRFGHFSFHGRFRLGSGSRFLGGRRFLLGRFWSGLLCRLGFCRRLLSGRFGC